MIRSTLRRLARRFRRREDGTATIEFVIFVPTVVMIFMASIEAGFYMAKHVMLERGLDLVIRDVRLGNIPLAEMNAAGLRQRICAATPMLVDCPSILKIEMRPVSMDTFDMPAVPTTCVNRGNVAPPPGAGTSAPALLDLVDDDGRGGILAEVADDVGGAAADLIGG